MTKLEEKLRKLGYKITHADGFIASKLILKSELVISINEDGKIKDYYVYLFTRMLRNQSQLDDYKLAINQLQKDLEVLKEYETKN